MCRQKFISAAMAGISIAMCCLVGIGRPFPGGTGKLVKTDLSVSSDAPVLDRPPCKLWPHCKFEIANLEASLKAKELGQIGILVNPVNGDVELRSFTLEIRSRNGVVFATQPIDQALKATHSSKPTGGSVFVLDRDAIKVGSQFFVPGNIITLTGKVAGKGEAGVDFYLVNIADARSPNTGSKVLKRD